MNTSQVKKKIRIKVNSEVRSVSRDFEVLVGDGFYLGVGSAPGDKSVCRILMRRSSGMPTYIMWGKDRGRVLLGCTGFHRIRMLTEKETKKAIEAIELYKRFS